jgi:hypothetical protein
MLEECWEGKAADCLFFIFKTPINNEITFYLSDKIFDVNQIEK